MHAGLGGGVIGLAGLAFLTVYRGDLNDAAPAALDHVANHLLGDVEHRIEVGVDHRIPIVAGHFQEHPVTGNTGVVD